MKKTFLIITAFLLTACAPIPSPQKETGMDNCQDVISYNCEQSGGEFINGECDCSATEDEFVEYEDSTGYCITAIGSPGGNILETTKKLLELKMLKNQLEESN